MLGGLSNYGGSNDVTSNVLLCLLYDYFMNELFYSTDTQTNIPHPIPTKTVLTNTRTVCTNTLLHTF